MKSPSKVRSRVYASIAGLGLTAVAYWLGTIHGATKALDQFRNLAFAATDSALRRELRFDSLLSEGNVEGARRAAMGAAASLYRTLEDEAAGAKLPPTDWMRGAIVEARLGVADYCAKRAVSSPAAEVDVCGNDAK